HPADRNPLSQPAFRRTTGGSILPIFLHHQRRVPQLKPAPLDTAAGMFRSPLTRDGKPQAINVEPEGCFDIRHHEEWDCLFDVRHCLGLSSHPDLLHTGPDVPTYIRQNGIRSTSSEFALFMNFACGLRTAFILAT